MERLSLTEENYLKVIYTLAGTSAGRIPNLAIAERLCVNPAAVTEMLAKLRGKRLIEYSRGKGARLTKEGERAALAVIRRHRLWETFLVEKLGFAWDEVHDVAEQLEHVRSDKLVMQLSKLLGDPKFDPHGDPIPDWKGKVARSGALPLSAYTEPGAYRLVAVGDASPAFLQFLDRAGFAIGDTIAVEKIEDFDRSMNVLLNGKKKSVLSERAASRLLVVPAGK